MSGIKPTGSSEYKKRDKFKGCRQNKKAKEQIQGIVPVDELAAIPTGGETKVEAKEDHGEHDAVWRHIEEVYNEALVMKNAAETNNLDKTVKKYDKAMKTLTTAQKQVAKAEELKKRESKPKEDKPKKERQPLYSEVFIETIEIDGKLKDKYDIQKTATSPVITKYRAHKPLGITVEQLDIIKTKLNELKELVNEKNKDYTEAQYKKAIYSFFKPSKSSSSSDAEANTSSEEVPTDF